MESGFRRGFAEAKRYPVVQKQAISAGLLQVVYRTRALDAFLLSVPNITKDIQGIRHQKVRPLKGAERGTRTRVANFGAALLRWGQSSAASLGSGASYVFGLLGHATPSVVLGVLAFLYLNGYLTDIIRAVKRLRKAVKLGTSTNEIVLDVKDAEAKIPTRVVDEAQEDIKALQKHQQNCATVTMKYFQNVNSMYHAYLAIARKKIVAANRKYRQSKFRQDIQALKKIKAEDDRQEAARQEQIDALERQAIQQQLDREAETQGLFAKFSRFVTKKRDLLVREVNELKKEFQNSTAKRNVNKRPTRAIRVFPTPLATERNVLVPPFVTRKIVVENTRQVRSSTRARTGKRALPTKTRSQIRSVIATKVDFVKPGVVLNLIDKLYRQQPRNKAVFPARV